MLVTDKLTNTTGKHNRKIRVLIPKPLNLNRNIKCIQFLNLQFVWRAIFHLQIFTWFIISKGKFNGVVWHSQNLKMWFDYTEHKILMLCWELVNIFLLKASHIFTLRVMCQISFREIEIYFSFNFRLKNLVYLIIFHINKIVYLRVFTFAHKLLHLLIFVTGKYDIYIV